jgi:uncharacterized membrane protein YoaK (UPF0700 family)
MKPARKQRAHGQMSEAPPTVAFLTLSGGLQDAYSYCVRGKVFANAQTGNIVLMSQHFFRADWRGGLRYLVPLAAFTCGVLVAEQIRARYRYLQAVHWRQLILIVEIVLLLIAGFLPQRADFLANALVSFSCAMQVQTFRKINGHTYASTMCIGNLRCGMEAFSAYLRTGKQALLNSAGQYFGVILLFALGAGCGGVLSAWWGRGTIWVSCALLMVSFALMFLRGGMEAYAEKQDTPQGLSGDNAGMHEKAKEKGEKELPRETKCKK